MKCFAAVLAVALLGTTFAGPVKPARASAIDLLISLENIVEKEGHELLSKIVNVIHHAEGGILAVKHLVPKIYEKIHQEADEVLEQLRKLSDEVQELLGGKSEGVYYGFDILSDLTKLTGGTKLSTVISLLQLAEKTNRVIQDAKEFVPKLHKELEKIQGKIQGHVSVLTKHVVKELGVGDILQLSIVDKIEDLLEEAQEEAHILLLDLLHKIEHTFIILKSELPEVYKVLEKRIEEIKKDTADLVTEISEHVGLSHSFGVFDIAGDLTKGTSLGTVIKVMSLIDKFNKVVQDARDFGPKAESLLEHSVEKVAISAQDFFTHASQILAKGH